MTLFYTAKLSFDKGPVEGAHKYSLPFCECPCCGLKGAASGLSYPWINGNNIFHPKTLRKLLWDKSGESSWSEYLAVSVQLRRGLQSDLPTAPGTEFGAWKGKVLSKVGNLVLGGFDDLLVERKTLHLIQKSGFKLETFEIELRPKKDYKPDLVEVFAPPVGLSCPSSGIRLCTACNRGSTKMAICVNASTIPANAHVFRLRDAPNALVFSRTFVEYCERHGLRGITFVPVLHEFCPQQNPEKFPVATTADGSGFKAGHTVITSHESSETKVRRSRSVKSTKAIKFPKSFYSDWIGRLRQLSETVNGVPGSSFELQIEPQASQVDITEMENALGVEIPEPLKQFFLTGTRALNFKYSIEAESNGGICLRLEDLPEHQKNAREWATETWISDDIEQKIIWRNAFPFAHLKNGDLLGLDLRDRKPDPKLIYLNHEDESFPIASSFRAFLQAWQGIFYIGPELWELEPFLDDSGYLCDKGKTADNLQKLVAGAGSRRDGPKATRRGGHFV